MSSILEDVFSSSEDELNKMLISLVGMPKDQVELELSTIKSRVEEVAQTIPTKGNKGDKGDKGDQGIQGPKGEPGKDGRDGYQGKDGKQGVDGKAGLDGKDGVSIIDVNVAFDNHLVITLSDGTEIDAGVIGSLNDNLQNVVANYVSNGANGTLIYKGLWNASTNTPTLSLSSSDTGAYYVVSVAGSTNLSDITDWQVNDWAIFNGTAWQKIDNSDLFNPSAVAITGGAINGTTIGSTTASTGKFTSVTTPSVTATTDNLTLSAISTGAVKFNTLGGLQAQVSNTASSVNYVQLTGGAANVPVSITSQGSDADIGLRLSSFGAAALRLFTNNLSTEQARVSHTASAVNYVQVTGAATGGFPLISAQGSDANPHLYLAGKGSGGVKTQYYHQVGYAYANYISLSGVSTTQAPSYSVAGSDTNISMAFLPKGTGAIDLAAGTSGVNISNGGTVTAITRTSAGSGYTSIPSVAISAPTTAGGVQAIATVGSMVSNVSTVQAGGTGYTLNDTLTLVGGTPAGGSGGTYTVTAVSGGVVTAVTPLNFGQYSVLPTNPVSVTGGTGSSCTLNVTYSVGTNPSFTISNAGSGYIEQPTITFSGGGGSGAAAYATVGGTPQIKGLGSALNFYVANQNIALQLEDLGGTGTAYWKFRPGNGTVNPIMISSAAGGQIATSGTSPLIFQTSSAIAQFQVSHTASSVNYVQVTGSATGNATGPIISTQGSDASIPLFITAKGGSTIKFSNNASSTSFSVSNTSSQVNYLEVTGGIAGAAPKMSAQGTDTNIDLSLTPKGTGRVKFGTYTGTILTPTGFVEIVDSGGTVRRLLVG